jgi:hypothetical protein
MCGEYTGAPGLAVFETWERRQPAVIVSDYPVSVLTKKLGQSYL